MQKDVTFREKFALLTPWLSTIIEMVKKDLKNDHLKRDLQFCKRYLSGKNIAKLTDEEMVEAYMEAIEDSEKGEAIAEFISNRWLLKNSEIYHFFEQRLKAIDPNFTELQELSLEHSKKLSEESSRQFGASKTYIFSILNSVVFPDSIFHALESQAKEGKIREEEQLFEAGQKNTLEELKKGYEQQIARLTDKYEKKVAGLQKMYAQDTELLKKQLAQLQRKLALK